MKTWTRDNAFSLVNDGLGMAGVLMVQAGLQTDVITLVLGALAVAASFGLSIWLNHGVYADQLTGSLRKLLKLGGTFAVAHSWVTDSQLQMYSGIVLSGATMMWSQWHYSQAPGPNLVGTTIVDIAPPTPKALA